MKKHEFTKIIPLEWQKKLGATRFKISLIKAKDIKEVRLLKALLEFKVRDIYLNPHLQSKEASVQYLKDCVLLHFLGETNLSNNVTYKPKVVITFQSIIETAMKQREMYYNSKQNILYKQGVDTSIKKDTTLLAYKAILKHINNFFGENYDLNQLSLVEVRNLCNKLNNSYVKHLKSIFKKANNENPEIINWFDKLETSVEERYGNINKNIDFFTFAEIETITNHLNEEQSLLFNTLLYTGMRFDEIISLKKSNIKNDSFYFKDSKTYFDKIVPIHKNILDKIYEKSKSIKDNDYLFFNISSNNKKRNIHNIRVNVNNKLKNLNLSKTLHKTRTTFITYLNYFRGDFSSSDIKSFTHQLSGEDQKTYNKAKNVDRLRNIIDSIDFQNLQQIEKQEMAS